MPEGYPNPSNAETLRVLVPRAAAIVAGFREVVWLTPDGEVEALSPDEARHRLQDETVMVCHARATARRLDVGGFAALDLLELFAFVRPARFCVPTPGGLAAALGLPAPRDPVSACVTLTTAARALLQELAAEAEPNTRALAEAAERGGWGWGAAVLAALPPAPTARTAGLRTWIDLKEWQDTAPPPPPGALPVSGAEARDRLASLLGDDAEPRPQQADYAEAVAAAFAPREAPDRPQAVLAEAGTGVGKTLGYIAPASLWAERNEGAVWISTYTRNLQTQIAGELDRLYPDPGQKRRRVVIRKGRENFLCLLNYEDAVRGTVGRPSGAAALALIARWLQATEAGDLVAGDFPGWLAELIGRGRVNGLADRRGECVHSACSHFRKCFVEKNVRAARNARLVVANHALVMAQAALGGLDDGTVPTRYVFDEGHHLLEAADSAFSVRLSGAEGRELRRWLLGAEASRSRARGLQRRIGDLVDGDDEGHQALIEILVAARILPADGWHQRVAEAHGLPGFEHFLSILRRQVLARAPSGPGGDSPYGVEAEARPTVEGLVEAGGRLAEGLDRLAGGLRRLSAILRKRLEDPDDPPEIGQRQRLDAVIRALDRRADMVLGAWSRLLRDLAEPAQPETVEWLALDRSDGAETDIALNRNWIDPGIPFAEAVAKPAHGIVVTSATLTDGEPDPALAWGAAEAATGLRHLAESPRAARIASPFDYAAQTRIVVVTDIPRDDMGQVAAAFAALMKASRGGALGLFTAIARLREVHRRIAPVLEADGLLLLAQHVDAMTTATLVDIFRAEEDSCLLGTDAMRDGVDVPGRSLRLMVFDRVPWPRPDILHKARKPVFGGAAYDDRIARLRLRQAYGRLVRRADDRGVFVILDRQLPSRLLGAFPPGVPVSRIPLNEAVALTMDFISSA
ncbi:MAG TPA: ATP-dependent DNA helicase [Stellaceae bacterium]|jgi:ATP-dependent DNA helicase DinG|nr:ATP-dependent DNA helicase [Stellaceae bacterium]